MKKLTKSKTNSMIAGVCGGIAEYFGIDPTLVRVGYLIFTFLTAGSPILLYLMLAFVIPEAE
ncbi:MAG TPA: PspC domain-containing protein [Atopostipes sp.]|nr:PspC domain-containing protein [Atopostipes sp.]